MKPRPSTAGKLDGPLIDRLAVEIARFHDATPPRYQAAAAQRLANVAGRTMRDIAHATEILGPRRVVLLHQQMQVGLIQAMSEVDARGAEGHVKRLHGDLHLGNVALIDGRPVIFDALEFDEAMATVDVLHDAAFLVMDLWARGADELAARAWSMYLAARDDYSGLALAPLFVAMRAAVRAKVALNAAALADADAAQRLRSEAAHYVETASAALQQPKPRVVAIGGLSGAGKSTVARALAPLMAPAVGAVHLRSDVLRKRRARIDFADRLPSSAYTEEESVAVYAGLLERAQSILMQGFPVIVDAVFARPQERRAIADLARRMNVTFDGIWFDLDLETRQTRIAERASDASDATSAVAEAQEAYDLGEIDWRRIDAGADAAAEAIEALDLQASSEPASE